MAPPRPGPNATNAGTAAQYFGPTHRQRRSEVNAALFHLLHSKMPLTKIADFLEISWPALYDKIDFLHRQCLKFQAGRTSSALDGSTKCSWRAIAKRWSAIGRVARPLRVS
jgi:hypothetical protein